jgi:hypothetical protein
MAAGIRKEDLRIGETPGAEEDAFGHEFIITTAQESSIYKTISVRFTLLGKSS